MEASIKQLNNPIGVDLDREKMISDCYSICDLGDYLVRTQNESESVYKKRQQLLDPPVYFKSIIDRIWAQSVRYPLHVDAESITIDPTMANLQRDLLLFGRAYITYLTNDDGVLIYSIPASTVIGVTCYESNVTGLKIKTEKEISQEMLDSTLVESFDIYAKDYHKQWLHQDNQLQQTLNEQIDEVPVVEIRWDKTYGYSLAKISLILMNKRSELDYAQRSQLHPPAVISLSDDYTMPTMDVSRDVTYITQSVETVHHGEVVSQKQQFQNLGYIVLGVRSDGIRDEIKYLQANSDAMDTIVQDYNDSVRRLFEVANLGSSGSTGSSVQSGVSYALNQESLLAIVDSLNTLVVDGVRKILNDHIGVDAEISGLDTPNMLQSRQDIVNELKEIPGLPINDKAKEELIERGVKNLLDTSDQELLQDVSEDDSEDMTEDDGEVNAD